MPPDKITNAVPLREDSKSGALIEDAVGAERNYYPRTYHVNWTIESLQVHKGFAFRDEGAEGPPKLQTFVIGAARLQSDYDLSVIGEPGNKTSQVELSFHPDDRLEMLTRDSSDISLLSYSQAYGRASLGFNRADWESSSGDQWWLQCNLHSAALQSLIDAVESRSIVHATISVKLKGLFSDEPPFVPFSEEAHLFLRPNVRDNTIQFPEPAMGWLVGLGMQLTSVDLNSRLTTPASEAHTETPYVEPDSPAESENSGLSLIAAQIESLRATLKWIGVFITLGVLLLLLT